MKALLMMTGEAADVIEVEDIEETLGGEVEHLWPFEDQQICMAVLIDREDMEPNRCFEECGMVRGPILFVGAHDDLDDLTEEEISFIEARASFAEEEYRDDDYDPYEEDAQDEEDFCGTHIVDEDEFYDSITREMW